VELILLRHGETDLNREGVYCGWTDAELNEKGMKDAQKLGVMLASEDIASIHSSDLKRARKTAEIVRQGHAPEVRFHEGLREMDFGLWEQKSFAEIDRMFPDKSGQWKQDWVDFQVPGGESGRVFFRRVLDALEPITDRESGTILLVTHGGPIRCILSHYLCGGMDGFWRFKIDPGSMSRISVKNDFAVLEVLNLK
jgi:alpha-ribazole phosphatase